jgi:plastocyanin
VRLGVLAVLAALALAIGAEAAGERTEVAIPGRLYAPGELDALAGQTVTWRNADSSSHTVSSEDDAFDSGYLSPGATFSHAFAATGTFPYFCRIHRTMRGVVRVYALILDGPPLPLPPGWLVSFRGVSPAPGETVVLERRSGRAFVTVAQGVSAADGSFVFSQRPTAPGSYRARAGTASSPFVRVAVKPSVAVAAAAGRVRVSTAPARPRSVALLQLYDRESFGWVTVARGRLDARSRLTLTAPGGAAHARVVVRGRDGWADGVSRTFVLR